MSKLPNMLQLKATNENAYNSFCNKKHTIIGLPNTFPNELRSQITNLYPKDSIVTMIVKWNKDSLKYEVIESKVTASSVIKLNPVTPRVIPITFDIQIDPSFKYIPSEKYPHHTAFGLRLKSIEVLKTRIEAIDCKPTDIILWENENIQFTKPEFLQYLDEIYKEETELRIQKADNQIVKISKDNKKIFITVKELKQILCQH